jgi:transposase
MTSKYSPKKYDDDFKREAVRLVTEEGRSAASVERDLGIGNGAISRWRKSLSEDSKTPFPGKGKQRPEEAELRRLKRENEILQQERDILKKALAIFSKAPK